MLYRKKTFPDFLLKKIFNNQLLNEMNKIFYAFLWICLLKQIYKYILYCIKIERKYVLLFFPKNIRDFSIFYYKNMI